MDGMNVYFSEVEDFEKMMAQYAGDAEEAINSVLHQKALQPLAESIVELIHPSGRTWQGKIASATSIQPFRQREENLSIEIRSKKAYQYLYFPNDGSTTINHYGDQHFMYRGVERKSDLIIDMCLQQLEKGME